MTEDKGMIEKFRQRYLKAAHRVQTAISFMPERPNDPYKDLRTGLDLSKSDMGGLADLLIEKGIFTKEEYLEAISKSAETEAEVKETELSIRFGRNIKTL